MPMDFPDMRSLKDAAEVHDFRAPNEFEQEQEYRMALAKHVRSRDKMESYEIEFGVGWDKWTDQQKQLMITETIL